MYNNRIFLWQDVAVYWLPIWIIVFLQDSTKPLPVSRSKTQLCRNRPFLFQNNQKSSPQGTSILRRPRDTTRKSQLDILITLQSVVAAGA